ncbi:MAG: helix-turn-helix domain-containing protein [Blastocatellia bacterium]|nr:helix-turn-helix domain-containing protein [Blastocatellia bacterium]
MADLTAEEVATRLGVAAITVRKWLAAGRFPGARKAHPRLWLIPESDLEGFQRPRMGKPKRRGTEVS